MEAVEFEGTYLARRINQQVAQIPQSAMGSRHDRVGSVTLSKPCPQLSSFPKHAY